MSRCNTHVLTGSGVNLTNASLCHINNNYIYNGKHIDPHGLFTIVDLTDETRALQSEVVKQLKDLKVMLSAKKPPKGDPPFVCGDPYECLYYDHCTSDKDEYWVFNLPRLRSDKLRELHGRGIVRVQDLPDDMKLSAIQERVKKALLSGKEYISPDLIPELNGVEYPLHFLDFETFMPTIPRYKGTRPYQTLPFQWSCHILHKNGKLDHKEYICTEDQDPREEFTATMLDVLGSSGTIATYSPYEKRIISQMANELPEYGKRLMELLPRLWDLYAVISSNYYHPGFGKSFSIKSVLPTLVKSPDLDYKKLDVQDGGQASLAYEVMICKSTDVTEKKRIRTALTEYCKLDTFAMVELRRELLKK